MKHILVLLGTIFLFAACSPTDPLPQPRRVVDLTDISGAERTPDWELAAVGYEYSGQGVNYRKAGLEPVFLVLRNKSDQKPRILLDEVQGIGPDGEFLPYSVDEAERLVTASETFKLNAKNALKSGTLGAAVGAGLGAIIGSITGGDAIASGAALGAGFGGMTLGVASVPEAQRKLKRLIREDLENHAWKETTVAPHMTRMGYVYLPGEEEIDRVRVSVRVEDRVRTYELPVVSVQDSGGGREQE
ncbi:MAG: hypothetical protein ACLFSY_09495 [Desulfonatronovibrionaceae bacterium]